MHELLEQLKRHQFTCRVCTKPKYKGCGYTSDLCIAEKAGVEYFAFQIESPDTTEHHRQIAAIQGDISRMAPILVPFDGAVLSTKIEGSLLWELDTVPSDLEAQLEQFVNSTQARGLIHGDLRPWNILVDSSSQIHVFDWRSLSCFEKRVNSRVDLIEGHYQRYAARNITIGGINAFDALKIMELVRGQISLVDAWGPHALNTGPVWCKLGR